jgi:beta-barrel assembly-enhancing protease
MKRSSLSRRGAALGGALLALTLVAPAASAHILSRKTEISMGREAAQEFERSAVIDNDPFLTAKIRRIGARLVSVCEAPDYPFEFHLVDSGVVNAFALPGGFVYIYRGLAQLLPNDDALAFVMAHEISHVTRRHSVRQLEKNLVINTILNAIAPGNTGAQILEMVLGARFTRLDETQADTVGLITAAKAGFDPAQAPQAMMVIRRAAGSGKGVPALLRDHPLPDSRIAVLTKQAAELKAQHARQEAPEVAADKRTPEEKLGAVPAVTIAGLQGVGVAPCCYFPLKTGARWVYRTQGSKSRGKTTVTVLEMVPGTPEGVYRVEMDMGLGVAATQWVATTADRVLRRSVETDPWRTEFRFPRPVEAPLIAAATAPASPVALTVAPAPEPETIVGGSGPEPEAVAPAPEPRAPAPETAAPEPRPRPASGPSFRSTEGEKVRVPAGEFETVKVECLSSEGKLLSTCWFAPDVGLVKRVSAVTGTVQELETMRMPRPTLDLPTPPGRNPSNAHDEPPGSAAAGSSGAGREEQTADLKHQDPKDTKKS